MLQHYSPYKVAENFNVLSCLAGGRVDLGIGGGPGGMPNSTRALQHDTGYGAKSLQGKVLELQSFLQNRLEPDHPLYGLQASPLPTHPADLFVLGTTPSSAEMAGGLGLPYVFALFLNNDEGVMAEAIQTYRDKFDPVSGNGPQSMLALPVMVAETDEEARTFASGLKLVRVHVESGRIVTVFTLEAAEEFRRQSGENCVFEVRDLEVIHGSKETVRRKLAGVQAKYQVDEVFVVTGIRDFKKRLHSYKLLSEALPQTLTS
jgi:luciferase family oxidoreductase group 1